MGRKKQNIKCLDRKKSFLLSAARKGLFGEY